jgi:hypothetical protein
MLTRSAAILSGRSTKIDIFLTYRIARVTVFQNETIELGSRLSWALRDEDLTVSSGIRLGNGAASP